MSTLIPVFQNNQTTDQLYLNHQLSSPSSLIPKNNLPSVSISLHETLEIELSIAEELAKTIFELQNTLGDGKAIKIEASQTLPVPLLIVAQRIYCLMKRIGQGTYSTVYEARLIPTTRHMLNQQLLSPSKPRDIALKAKNKPNKSFSPKKRELVKAVGEQQVGLDSFLATYRDQEERGWSVHTLFTKDLSQTNFSALQDPVVSILKTLITIGQGLAALHRAGRVHRDIKGGNLLVFLPNKTSVQPESLAPPGSSNDEISGAVTDFDFLMWEPSLVHNTGGTPNYLDPSMFGPLELCVSNQKERLGIQSREGDIFALGITIQKDLLFKFIRQITSGKGISNQLYQLLDALKPTKKTDFKDDELIQRGSESKFRVIYRQVESNSNEDYLLVLPDLDLIRTNMNLVCSLLNGVLAEKEVAAVQQLAELSCLMQEVESTKRPSIESVLTQMKHILAALQGSADTSSTSASNNSSRSHPPDQNNGQPVTQRDFWPFERKRPVQVLPGKENQNDCLPTQIVPTDEPKPDGSAGDVQKRKNIAEEADEEWLIYNAPTLPLGDNRPDPNLNIEVAPKKRRIGEKSEINSPNRD